MRKYKWILVWSVMALTVIAISCKTNFETTKMSYTAEKSTMAFDRGKVLVVNICGGCHYDRDVGKFIGTQIHDVPGIIGKVYSANLTNSKTHGIPPRYTDAQLKYLLKTGVNKDGHFLPYMIRPNMADEDINAIIVYLRSGDGPVAAADTTIGLTHLNALGKAVMCTHQTLRRISRRG
jgi:mono/diheme cytochrome c family protein